MDPFVKLIVFLFIFLFVLPILTGLCCYFQTMRDIFFAGMLYFTSNEYSINVLPMPDWRGTARGYAFTAVSFFALPLLFSMILNPRYKVRFFPPGSFFYFLYFLAIIVSGYNAVHIHPWGFEVCKMCWMYITFLAAFNYLYHCKNLTFFAYLVTSILIILFLVGFDQKYRVGRFQVRSTFPHQNSLTMYLEEYGILSLGILMNEKMSKKLFVLCMGAFVCSVLLILFTFSRGGLVVYFGGIAIVCAFSNLLNGFSMRRLTLMFIGLLVMLSVVGYALPRIIQRFTKAPEQSKNTRIGLAIAAKNMANDFRLGVGANNFSEYSGLKHDYSTTEFFTPSDELAGIVETIYLLVAAECGWWGLGTLILWFLYYYFAALHNMIMLRKKPCCGFLIGAFAGLTCNYWHSTLEWSLKQYNNFAAQMIFYAMIMAIAAHRKSIVGVYKHAKINEPLKPVRTISPAFSFDFLTGGEASSVVLSELPAADEASPVVLPELPAGGEASSVVSPELPDEPFPLPDSRNDSAVDSNQESIPASIDVPTQEKD